jgi:hypothetical protein
MRTSAGQQKLSSTMLKSNRDVPPASQGRYAMPVLTQHDDDLSSQRDALPASKGQYAMPVTTGHNDESIIKSPFSESASTI